MARFAVRPCLRLAHARVRTLLEALGLYRGQPPVRQALQEREGPMHAVLVRRLQVRAATIAERLQRME